MKNVGTGLSNGKNKVAVHTRRNTGPAYQSLLFPEYLFLPRLWCHWGRRLAKLWKDWKILGTEYWVAPKTREQYALEIYWSPALTTVSILDLNHRYPEINAETKIRALVDLHNFQITDFYSKIFLVTSKQERSNPLI